MRDRGLPAGTRLVDPKAAALVWWRWKTALRLVLGFARVMWCSPSTGSRFAI